MLISDEKLYKLLDEHRTNVRQLTLTDQIHLHSRNDDASTLHDCIVKSTAGPMCSFGIEVIQTDGGGGGVHLATNTVNEKKRQKMTADLERLLRTVENVNYQKSASAKVQKQHREKV